MEEEHQTWYFFTCALFVMIFLENSALFNFGKSRNDSELPETIAMQAEISEDTRTRKHSEEKSFDQSNEVRNASVQKDHDNSETSGINVDGHSPKKQQDNTATNENHISHQDLPRSASTRVGSRENSSENLQLRWEAVQELTTKSSVLSNLLFFLLLLGLGRLSRSWNQTGIKWADRPDIGDWLVKPENRAFLSVCYLISLLVIVGFRYNRQNVLTSFVFIIGAANAYIYRTVTGSLQLPWIPNEPITKGIRVARFTYCCVATMVVWSLVLFYRASRHDAKRRSYQEFICKVCESLEGLLSAMLLLEILLQRPHNVTLLGVFVVQEHVLSNIFWKR